MTNDNNDPVRDAIDAVIDELPTLGVTPAKVKEGDDPVVQVIVRVPAVTRDRWKDAAERNKISMSEFIRNAVDDVTANILDCPHRSRRVYPWAQICNDCGVRLNG
jgi:hypothetical protein